MQNRKSNTLGKAKSRGDIAKDVRRKAGNKTFLKIIKIVLNTKAEEFPALLAKIEVPKFVSFIVGKVFQHRAEDCVPQYHWDGFVNLLLNEAREQVISVGKAIKNISEYVLPENMNDTSIQNKAQSIPIEWKSFWATLYCLIIEPELGKKMFNYELKKDKVYILHVRKRSGEVVAFDVRWRGVEWRLSAYGFGTRDWWYDGSVFLFPATSAKA